MIKLNGYVQKYAGPPGTGKSTTLLNLVDELLGHGVQPENIIYTTFTRAGANEAKDRACIRFNLPAARLPYFRTLHSLCFLANSPSKVLTFSDWCFIGKTLGIGFSTKLNPEEGVPRGHTKGDQMLSLWSLSRVMRIPLDKVHQEQATWMTGGWDITFAELQQFVDTVTNYKTSSFKIDYNDMLESFLKDAPAYHSDYVIVDEAQDLSPLQWLVVEKLCTHAKGVFIAGDDDQCIHEWNGASPSTFVELPSAEFKVLPQSYRIPGSVHKLAESIIQRVPSRIPKTYLPRDEIGQVQRINDLDSLDLSKGTWLLLARNIVLLEQYSDHCHRLGLMFSGSAMPISTKLLTSIETWTRLLEKKHATAADCKVMYTFMSQRDRIKHGYKTLLNAVEDRALLNLEMLQKSYGCLTGAPWDQAMDMISDEDLSYLKAVQKNEGLRSKPRIEISTIHGAKGKEADFVCINPDMTYRTHDSYQRQPEAEHRVWYVGVTRARNVLFILNPKSNLSYDL